MNTLNDQSVNKAFFRYLIPSLLGMLLVAVNIVIDGIMVGNKLGSTALAGIGIASPVYTLFLAMSLWIGIGGATLYSRLMGAGDKYAARRIYTQSLILIFVCTVVIGVVAFLFKGQLVYALGANEDTFPYAAAYMRIMLLFGFVFTVENALSVFVRNDGNPNLAMIAQITFALSNIGINYLILYVFDGGVAAVALGTIIAAGLGLLVLLTHFLKKQSNLKFSRFKWEKALIWSIIIIGFPSFLAEVGISVFTVSHNNVLERLAGTDGVAAFTVVSYLHSLILMTFLGLGSAVQPLISYYYGSERFDRIRQTLAIAVRTALIAGGLLFVIMQLASGQVVRLFGDFSPEVTGYAIYGLRLFVFAYLFMGVNLVMMTFFQTTGYIKVAVGMTVAREMVFMLALLFTLPLFIGISGVWLSIPLAEALGMLYIIYYYRRYDPVGGLAKSTGMRRSE